MSDDDYLCVGICMTDPNSGYCLGCGRPPLPVQLPQPAAALSSARQTPASTAGESRPAASVAPTPAPAPTGPSDAS